MADHVYCKLRARIGEADQYHYLYALVDTGNQARDTIMSEKLFEKIAPKAEILSTTKNLLGIEDRMQVLGRCSEDIKLEFYSTKDNAQVKYKCRPLIVRDCNIDFLLSNADLCKLDVSIRPAAGTIKIPLGVKQKDQPQKMMTIPLTKKPLKSTPVYAISDETIYPGKELEFPAFTSQKVGREVQIVLDKMQHDEPVVGACTLDIVRTNHKVACRIANVGLTPMTIKRGTQIGMAHPVDLNGATVETSSNEFDVGFVGTCAAMARTSQFQGRQQLELNKEAYGDVSTRAKLRERIWRDLNFHQESFGLEKEEKKLLVNQLARHRPALALEYDDLGMVKDIQINIDTGDSEPVNARCRPLAPHLRKPLKEQIEKWLAQGVIKPSAGPWASPIVAVPKKNGGWRFCADYRALNAVTKRDSRPVAHLEEKLARIRGDPNKPMKYYASLDLSEAYHSVKIAEEDQDKSAIITPLGLYKFVRMSFGLRAAPAAFHMVVKKIEDAMEK